jgi:hypothetical protein
MDDPEKPKSGLDETTRKIAERMLSTPPKPHDQMKVGKAKRKTASTAKKKAGKKP